MLTCAYCGNQFQRHSGREAFRIKHKKQGPFCSKSCAANGTSKFAKGEKNLANILNEKAVMKIRHMRERGYKVSELTRMTGMSEQCIRSIVNYKSWTHLPRVSKDFLT